MVADLEQRTRPSSHEEPLLDALGAAVEGILAGAAATRAGTAAWTVRCACSR